MLHNAGAALAAVPHDNDQSYRGTSFASGRLVPRSECTRGFRTIPHVHEVAVEIIRTGCGDPLSPGDDTSLRSSSLDPSPFVYHY